MAAMGYINVRQDGIVLKKSSARSGVDSNMFLTKAPCKSIQLGEILGGSGTCNAECTCVCCMLWKKFGIVICNLMHVV